MLTLNLCKVQLPILSVKKNPQSPMSTQLGVLSKGTIIEVNVSELGIVTAGGKVVWGRWAQVSSFACFSTANGMTVHQGLEAGSS